MCDIFEDYALPAYHGTASDITAFELDHHPGKSRESKIGFWFTNNPQVASEFAAVSAHGTAGAANVMPVRLRLRHPFEALDYNEVRDIVDRFTTFARPGWRRGNGPEHGMMRGRQVRTNDDKVDYDALRKWMQAQGYDGIVIRNTLVDSPDGKTPIDQYVVFDASQIRSQFARFASDKPTSSVITDSITS